MALVKTLPTARGVDATYWRATDFRVNTLNASAPYAVIMWTGYASQAAYEGGKLPLAERLVTIPADQFLPLMGANAQTYSDLAATIDSWVRDCLDYATEFTPNPDYDPQQPESETNSPGSETVTPGPWADATLI